MGPTPSALTPVHSDLAKLCLVSKCFAPALPFLNTDITIISKENQQFDAVHLLLYYYYGGCIYTALKQFDRALYFLEICVTCPTAAVSPSVPYQPSLPGGGDGQQWRGRQLWEHHLQQIQPCTCRSHCQQQGQQRLRHTSLIILFNLERTSLEPSYM